ncbi:2590_t:CDS:2 [Rhizophagus irregularis]|nr:2590_t:CDS:2 [Rhizophagus irregularis]
MHLSTALTELVIPIVDESNLTHTHLFTRRNDSKDDTFYDTLMATTAAPTFFPPYEIKGRGFFLNGALHLNNPAMAAYEKAIQYDAAKEKIFVLSLAQNLHKVVLPQQENNTDRSMYNLLGKCYQRWQVWFEEPISLDDCERVPHLLELGNQYIEKLDASDENPINKINGKIDRADKQENLAKKFEKFIEKPKKLADTYKTNSRLFTETILGDEENIQEAMVNNPINESLIDLDESQTSDTNKRSEDQTSRIKENKKLISSLNILKSLAVKAAYSKRLTFIYHALNSPNKKEILFSNTQFTEEEINKRFRELALYFHSDKMNRPNTSIWLQETHKNLGTELFFVIIEFKDNLLNDLKKILQNEGYLTFHEKNANKLWKIAIDYRNAVKEQWSKLRLLRKEDIEEIPSEKLKSLSIELRGNMALCLYISNKFIEAQLYALAAIQLHLKNSQKVKDGDPMADTRENDDSVDVEETPELDTEINIEDRSEHTIALVKTVDQEFSFFDKKTIQNSINNDMAKVSIKLMLKADRSLVRYQIPQEEILHAKNCALKYKASGVVAMGGAMIVGTSVTVAACFNIYEAVAIIGGGPFALIGGLLALGLEIWAGVNLWKRGNKLLEEPKICEKLNEIMVNVLKAYDKGEYRKFIDAFSEEFKKDGCLLKLEKREDTFDTKYIIDTLLNYGFRSDGIAYLLNLLGEVLCSGKIKIKGKVPKDLKELAMKAFDGVLNEKLENEARRLDDRIHELREKNHIASMLSKFRDFVSLEEYKSIAQEHKDDSQEMPFQSRLEEMRNITKINQAIFDILDAGKEEIERAIKTIKEVRDSINSLLA